MEQFELISEIDFFFKYFTILLNKIRLFKKKKEPYDS